MLLIMKKTLGICGDSFMSPLNGEGRGKHFTEILAEKLDLDLFVFARGGCSNQTIRLQMEEMLKNPPDLVLIGLTSPDRIEIPIGDLSTDDYFKKYSMFNFLKDDGIYNIEYHTYSEDQSSDKDLFKKTIPKMRSETMNNIFNNIKNAKNFYSQNQIRAIEYYFQYLYDCEWKKQQDSWIIADGLNKLIRHNIDFLLILNHLSEENFYFCKEKIISKDSELNPQILYSPDKISPYGFHLTEEDEIFLAEKWYPVIKERMNI
jgi:hypothetical protein